MNLLWINIIVLKWKWEDLILIELFFVIPEIVWGKRTDRRFWIIRLSPFQNFLKSQVVHKVHPYFRKVKGLFRQNFLNIFLPFFSTKISVFWEHPNQPVELRFIFSVQIYFSVEINFRLLALAFQQVKWDRRATECFDKEESFFFLALGKVP